MQVSRFLPIAAALAIATAGLTGCGVHGVKNEGKNEGYYVHAGGLEYQVQISRQLNPYDFEDRDYLVGLPKGAELRKGEEYFAVFIRAFNRDKEPAPATNDFYMTDTTGTRYTPIDVDTRVNRVAFRPAMVNPSDQLPLPGSLARDNTTQGGLILFRVPVTAYDSRPLVLHINPPGGGEAATVNLDV